MVIDYIIMHMDFITEVVRIIKVLIILFMEMDNQIIEFNLCIAYIIIIL